MKLDPEENILPNEIDYTKIYKHTGKQVLNLNSNKIGIVLRETQSGSIQVLESITPKVICTHDSWNTLELLEDETEGNI